MAKAKTTTTSSVSSSSGASSNSATKSEIAALTKRLQKLESICEKMGLTAKYNKYYS
tara:strand:- start:217 stop:387 length:171 start_codon:yes stop_codon:yes gene_type:complete